LRKDEIGSGDLAEQGKKGLFDREEDAGGGMEAADFGGVADELNRVAETLLGFEEQRFAGERSAVPERSGMLAADERLVAETPLVFAEAGGVVALGEGDDGPAHVGIDAVGIHAEDGIELSFSLLQAAGIQEGHTIIAAGIEMVGLEAKRLFVTLERLLMLSGVAEGRSEVAVGFGIGGSEREGAAE
jgi:hypothetical protein